MVPTLIYVTLSSGKVINICLTQYMTLGVLVFFQNSAIEVLACERHKFIIACSLLVYLWCFGYSPKMKSPGSNGIFFLTSPQKGYDLLHCQTQWNSKKLYIIAPFLELSLDTIFSRLDFMGIVRVLFWHVLMKFLS